jgi:hypothetical protein
MKRYSRNNGGWTSACVIKFVTFVRNVCHCWRTPLLATVVDEVIKVVLLITFF